MLNDTVIQIAAWQMVAIHGRDESLHVITARQLIRDAALGVHLSDASKIGLAAQTAAGLAQAGVTNPYQAINVRPVQGANGLRFVLV